MGSAECSIVIPAYNEQDRISRLLLGLNETNAEYLFVCDGADQTADIIRKFADTHPELTIRCLEFESRLGKGGGVYEGFKAAETSLVGFMDADNSTEFQEILRLFSYLDRYEGAIGSRHLPGSLIEVHQPISRRVQSRAFNLIIRLLFGLPFYDTQCGAKVFQKKALDEILPRMRSTGFEFDVELLWRMRQAGYSVIEVPVIWKDTHDSRLKQSDAFSMFLTLLRLRIGILPLKRR